MKTGGRGSNSFESFPGSSGSTEKDEKPVLVAKKDETTSPPPPAMDLSPLSFVLAELKLALIHVGAKWALLQSSDFDLTLENEPYHAIQVYVNTESRQYLVRVWGKTRERGDFRQASELQTLCRNVFSRRVACAGYLVSQYDFHFGDDFVFVDYPCQRQISRCCELSYQLPESGLKSDREGEGVGMCAQCSSVSNTATRIKRGDSDGEEGGGHYLLHEPKVVVKQESFDGNGVHPGDSNGGNDDDYGWSPDDEPAWELERPPRKRRRRQARQFTIRLGKRSTPRLHDPASWPSPLGRAHATL